MTSIFVTTCDYCSASINNSNGRSDRRFCSDKCKQAAYRKRKRIATKPVHALVRGNNADLIKEVVKLYAPDPSLTIADVTFGKGAFWKKVPHLKVTGSDLLTVPERQYDFRDLPYEDNSFDIVVLDPPYIHSPGRHMSDANYQNASTTKGVLYDDIRTLYKDGMREAKRVARQQIWVKCKDQVQAGQQCWAHVDILKDAQDLGVIGRDLFILEATSRPPSGRWTVQHHARKPMSYLWIFDIPSHQPAAQVSTLNMP